MPAQRRASDEVEVARATKRGARRGAAGSFTACGTGSPGDWPSGGRSTRSGEARVRLPGRSGKDYAGYGGLALGPPFAARHALRVAGAAAKSGICGRGDTNAGAWYRRDHHYVFGGAWSAPQTASL